jgi:DNA-directed RNA polymerase specialized sigma24 family protein
LRSRLAATLLPERNPHNECSDMARRTGLETWRLERSALTRLLAALDADAAVAAREYERLRQRLIRLFAFNGIERAEEAADAAFNRLARRLSEGEEVRHIESYLAGIARFIVLEERQRAQREREALLDLARHGEPAPGDEERMLLVLERCLLALPRESRELLNRYYGSDGGRRVREREALARELGLSPNSLRNRVLRLRRRLHEAFREQLESADPRDVGGPDDTYVQLEK